MDLMELRRGLLAQMSRGKDFVSGTFTCPTEGDSTITINFGKTFNKYLFFIEMTDASKQALVNSGASGTFSFGFVGVYPKRSINGKEVNGNEVGMRYVPSDDSTTSGSTSVITLSADNFTANIRNLSVTSPQNYLYRGYSYNYTVVSLD